MNNFNELAKALRDDLESGDIIGSSEEVIANVEQAATALERLAARPQTVTEALRVALFDIRNNWGGHAEDCASNRRGEHRKCDCAWPKIAARCDAALAAAPPPTSQWQTMESAPRDGTDILVYCGPVDDPMWAIAHWDDAEPDAERRKVYHMEERATAGWVFWWTGDMKRHSWPTHWKPLHAPQDKP